MCKIYNLPTKILRKQEECAADTVLRSVMADHFDEVIVIGIRHNRIGNDSVRRCWSALDNPIQAAGILLDIANELANK